VASGSPVELMNKTERSYTARYLKAYLQGLNGA
jgi:excinuclease UvrABC ATPase subunit